jgi:hypothetical protein
LSGKVKTTPNNITKSLWKFETMHIFNLCIHMLCCKNWDANLLYKNSYENDKSKCICIAIHMSRNFILWLVVEICHFRTNFSSLSLHLNFYNKVNLYTTDVHHFFWKLVGLCFFNKVNHRYTTEYFPLLQQFPIIPQKY